ncbi:MAG TPA: gamma-glutamyltransferase [Hyphomicrobiaceae bacterium]|nr:gamma-glutamyltransferase [Hyphomicrobiaceae bacterium]
MRNFHFPGRSLVYGRRAMCATSHPMASLTAIETMKAGGNAADAAIATAAVLGVVEPHMTGIGGDCFALIARPGLSRPVALNAAGRAPAGATPAWLAASGLTRIDPTIAHAVTVPGAVDGWTRLLADYGSIPLSRLLEPAIELAEQGFVVAPRVAADWALHEARISHHPGARAHLFKNGRVPRAGEVMHFPALARTLRIIAKEGREGFYAGAVAEDIVGELNALGGLHTLDDFAAQRAGYVTPISVAYRGVELCELPPSNQGIVALMVLKMLEHLRPPPDPVSVERYHVQLEAARLAFAMRDTFVADPDMADVPVEHLLSDAVICELAARVDPRRRRDDLGPLPLPPGSDTVYFVIVDENGMAISFINSLYDDFGSGIVTSKTGVVLHNRGKGFVCTPGHRNCIAPRKRPMHTLVPAMVLKDGEPLMAFGVMGAHFQPMGHVYVMTNMFHYGMDPQAAIDTPRVFFDGDTVLVEESVPEPVVAGLRQLGHQVAARRMPWGGAQVVVIDRERGVLTGASDPRKDGCALGY